MNHVCPTTKVSASNQKDLLNVAILRNFGCDVKVFDNWLEDRRSGIIIDEGAEKYEDCIRHLLKTHLAVNNE